jgi:carboxyl-terminal processing protease
MPHIRAGLKIGLFALLAVLLPAVADAQQIVTVANPVELTKTVYALLTKTFYRPIDAATIRKGADTEILAYARTHGVANPRIPMHRRSGDSVPDQILGDATATAKAYRLSEQGTIYAALHGMAKSTGDRWTEFFTPEEFAAFDAPLDPKSIYGIGVLVDVDPASKLGRAFYVVPEGPADEAGLVSGDLIVSVNGTSTQGLTQPQITSLLRGQEHTVVHLVVRHASAPDRPLALTRGIVRPPTIFVKMLPNKVAYVLVAVFASPTADEFSAALRRVQKEGARAVVFDLRNDGGGYVFAAVSIASHFFESGTVVTTLARDGVAITQESDDEDPQVSVPAAVLVNENTASASEILAASLQDNHAATLFGTRTFGKGVEQSVTRFSNGAAIKITTARYLTPANRDLNGKGIEPDVIVTLNSHALLGDPAHDAQLQLALQYLHSELQAQTVSQ